MIILEAVNFLKKDSNCAAANVANLRRGYAVMLKMVFNESVALNLRAVLTAAEANLPNW